MAGWLWILALLAICFVRTWYIISRTGKKSWPKCRRDADKKCSVGIFLGSGGHTAEMMQLIRCLNKDRYSPRTYIYCTGDTMSLSAARALEAEATASQADYTFLELPRARKVAQSMVSSALSSAWTILFALWHLVILPSVQRSREHARDFDVRNQVTTKNDQASRSAGVPIDVLVLNGPGTSVIIVLTCYVAKFIGLACPTIIYVESFARVSSLSLSGKILQFLVDRFIVQWEAAGTGDRVGDGGMDVSRPTVTRSARREYHGWLI